MLRSSLDGRGVWGRMDACICMAESLRCSTWNYHKIVISYTPRQNKKLKNKKQTLPHHSPTWFFSSTKSYPDNPLQRTSPFSIWPCLPPLPQPPAFLYASHWPLHSAMPFPLGPCCSLAANTVHPSPHTGTRTLLGCICTSAFTSSRKFLKGPTLLDGGPWSLLGRWHHWSATWYPSW